MKNHKGFWVSPSNLFTIYGNTWSENNSVELKDEKEIAHYVVVDGYKITSAINSKDNTTIVIKWCLINIEYDYVVEGKQWQLINASVGPDTAEHILFANTNLEFSLKWHLTAFPKPNAPGCHLHINLPSTWSQARVMTVNVGPRTCDVDESPL